MKKPKIYGYCRISNPTQSIERQQRNILSVVPQAKLYCEAFTGTKLDGRKEWEKLKNVVKAGDTIYFDSVSRMSRNAEDGVSDYMALYEKGVNLIFLKEPHINTDTYKRALEQAQLTETDNEVLKPILDGVTKALEVLAIQQIQLAFAQSEKEVMDLRQRTREGMLTAKLNGKQVGRVAGKKVETKKAVEIKEKIRKWSKDYDGQMTDIELLEILNVSRNSFYKYKREMKAELQS